MMISLTVVVAVIRILNLLLVADNSSNIIVCGHMSNLISTVTVVAFLSTSDFHSSLNLVINSHKLSVNAVWYP